MVSGSDPALTAPPDSALLPPDPVTAIVGRASAFPFLVPFEALGLLGPFLLGVVAARHRLLEDPARHVVLLRRVAVVGIGMAVAGGLPLGLVVATWLGTVALAELMRRRDARGPAEVLLRRLTYRR